MSGSQPSQRPAPGRVVNVLRDGYWTRTELVRSQDGRLHIRKTSKGERALGPWSVSAFRNEIHYMRALQGPAAECFPALLAAWDDGQHLGYDMAYVGDTQDVGALAQAAALSQHQADAFQDQLAHLLFDFVHEPVTPRLRLSDHVRETILLALTELTERREFAPLIDAEFVWINGRRLLGPRAAIQRLTQQDNALRALDQPPQVRLHGDFFLENIILPAPTVDRTSPTQITLLDPVSVAGVYEGHPLFDLVKYESYATGELLALRAEKIDLAGYDDPSANRYTYRVRFEDPIIGPFRRIDWQGRFRAAYEAAYGPVTRTAYDLLDAYFAAVMAICTTGLHQRARLLKTVIALNATLGANAHT